MASHLAPRPGGSPLPQEIQKLNELVTIFFYPCSHPKVPGKPWSGPGDLRRGSPDQKFPRLHLTGSEGNQDRTEGCAHRVPAPEQPHGILVGDGSPVMLVRPVDWLVRWLTGRPFDWSTS